MPKQEEEFKGKEHLENTKNLQEVDNVEVEYSLLDWLVLPFKVLPSLVILLINFFYYLFCIILLIGIVGFVGGFLLQRLGFISSNDSSSIVDDSEDTFTKMNIKLLKEQDNLDNINYVDAVLTKRDIQKFIDMDENGKISQGEVANIRSYTNRDIFEDYLDSLGNPDFAQQAKKTGLFVESFPTAYQVYLEQYDSINTYFLRQKEGESSLTFIGFMNLIDMVKKSKQNKNIYTYAIDENSGFDLIMSPDNELEVLNLNYYTRSKSAKPECQGESCLAL